MKALFLIEKVAQIEEIIEMVKAVMEDPEHASPFDERLIEIDGEEITVQDVPKRKPPEEKRRERKSFPQGYKVSKVV